MTFTFTQYTVHSVANWVLNWRKPSFQEGTSCTYQCKPHESGERGQRVWIWTKRKNFGQFPAGGEGYKHHIIIAKNPHPGVYTLHDESHEPDWSYLHYEETWCVPLHFVSIISNTPLQMFSNHCYGKTLSFYYLQKWVKLSSWCMCSIHM